ncbi:DUF551 domain-containing protein [Brevundimonas sp.]|uniref:DUF551 domain-containing protein n=1 Tax=Brevundimonas sp. TaxID=1871086 RepID=UPI0028AF085F|nr:DUF551 domain-containing protein [Brevundimonas sp.]
MTHPTDVLRLVPVPYVVLSEAAGLLDCEGYGPLALTLNNLLAAAPASPLPGGGWQDISTAPKDGTEVLVMLKPKVIRLGWYFKPSSRTEGWCDENGKRLIPSHWMPLPAAPTGDA